MGRVLQNPTPMRSGGWRRVGEKLGTGHGERMAAPTEYTSFRRASSTPSEVITIYYDSRANLMARGIIPAPRYSVRPNPFLAASHLTRKARFFEPVERAARRRAHWRSRR